jgi:2-oxoisovalerate dehydrogenase E1 component
VDNQAYKSEVEREVEWKRDPIKALHDYLVPTVMGERAWSELRTAVAGEVAAARDSALAQPRPDSATVTQFVWSSAERPQAIGGLVGDGITLPVGSATPRPPEPKRINMIEAVRRTLDVELALNPRCLVFGEDVGLKGGVHAATLGLQTKYGDGRVFDSSLSEEGIIGRAVGMALAGLVPVPEIQFRKYADPATEQLHNCGTLRWRTANRFAAPIIVRMPGGYRKIGDPWHSVTDEVAFAHSPGWLVAFPSNAEDAVGLLRTALRGNDPVLFFEHRAMLDAAWARRPYPGDEFMLPFGLARIVREGDDLTVVTWGAMVERCETAAREVGGSIEILDLRTILPWDKAAVLESVRKTSKCLIVHEDIQLAGFGAEVAATIVAEAFLDLDAPIQRLAAPAVPVPFSTDLMEGVVPRVDQIQSAMEALLCF